MSFKKTLIFFIILLLIGGYYYVFEVKIASKKQAAEEAEKKLFQLQEEDIQELTLKRSDQEITLKKEGDVWKMTQPVTASADNDAVKRIISSFVEAERDKTIAEKSDNDEEFGLDKPELIITVKLKEGGGDFRISIGNQTPTSSGYYARISDKPSVITVSTNVKTSLDKTMYDLRDKTVLDFDPAHVKKAILIIKSPETNETQRIELEQTESLWKIVSPKAFNADQTTIGSILSTVKNARIKEFITEATEDLSQYGLDHPSTTLSLIVGDDNTQKTLLLGEVNAAKEGIYAKHEAATNIFLVPQNLTEKFPQGVNDLRDKTLLAFTVDDVQKFELALADETVVLERLPKGEGDEDEGWKIIQPAAFKADNIKVRDFLWDAKALKIDQFVADDPEDMNQYGLGTPQVTLKVWEKDKEPPQQLSLGNEAEENKGVYAKLGDQNSVVLIKSDALQKLKKTSFDLRYRQILAFAQDQIEKIQLNYADTTLLLEKDGDVWNAKEPEKKEVLLYKVNNLFYDLKNLEFKEVLTTPETDLSLYGLDQPQVEVTFWEKKNKEVFTLLVGKKLAGKDDLYVKMTAENTVYAVDPSFLDELPRELKDLTEN